MLQSICSEILTTAIVGSYIWNRLKIRTDYVPNLWKFLDAETMRENEENMKELDSMTLIFSFKTGHVIKIYSWYSLILITWPVLTLKMSVVASNGNLTVRQAFPRPVCRSHKEINMLTTYVIALRILLWLVNSLLLTSYHSSFFYVRRHGFRFPTYP